MSSLRYAHSFLFWRRFWYWLFGMRGILISNAFVSYMKSFLVDCVISVKMNQNCIPIWIDLFWWLKKINKQNNRMSHFFFNGIRVFWGVYNWILLTPWKVDMSNFFILQMRKLEFQRSKWHAQVHTASQKCSWALSILKSVSKFWNLVFCTQIFKPSSFDLQINKVRLREDEETLVNLFQELLWGRVTSRIQTLHSFLF